MGGVLLLLIIAGIGWLLWMKGRDRRAVGSPVDVAFGTSEQGEQAVPPLERGPYPVEYGPPDGIRPGQLGTLIDETANPVDISATIVDLAVRGYLRIEEIPKHGLFGKPDWRLVRIKEGPTSSELVNYERVLLSGIFEGTGEHDAVKLSSLKGSFAPRLRRVRDALYDDMAKEGWFAGRPDRVRRRWQAAMRKLHRVLYPDGAAPQ